MIDYIAYLLVVVIIVWDLVSISNVLLGKYTSVFVRYFTVASAFQNRLKNLSENKEKEKKFKSLVISNEFLHILITLFLLGGSLSNRIPNIVWICLFSYYASLFLASRKCKKRQLKMYADILSFLLAI